MKTEYLLIVSTSVTLAIELMFNKRLECNAAMGLVLETLQYQVKVVSLFSSGEMFHRNFYVDSDDIFMLEIRTLLESEIESEAFTSL